MIIYISKDLLSEKGWINRISKINSMLLHKKINISGAEVYPIMEGGKGIGVSNGATAGAFAAAGAVGTISAVFPPEEKNGKYVQFKFKGKSRYDRSKEVLKQSIEGTIREIDKAYEISQGKGRIHLNILWGLSFAEGTISEVLKQRKGKVHGVVCGAGMPYRLGEIASSHGVYYYPIVSSVRAFQALWSRAYKNYSEFLGGIVYEDPWKAGGHNGLSNKENPKEPEDPKNRIKEIRKFLNENGLSHIPIIMAGGVWKIKHYEDWIEDKEIAPIAFQIGTRSLLTKESPISDQWKKRLIDIKPGDIELNKFSATGFYSSALKNKFLEELMDRATRQIEYRDKEEEEFSEKFLINGRQYVYIKANDRAIIEQWKKEGCSSAMKTPDYTLLFVQEQKAKEIRKDQRDCKGCLAVCKFSSWTINPETNYNTGKLADPRSFCILNSLENAICNGDPEAEIIFSGHNAFKFSQDELFDNYKQPTVKELVDSLINGN